MTLVDALREITHETRGSVGTMRLAMTTLLESGIDEATRVELIQAADREAVRLVAELAAIPALVAALVDESPVEPVDLSAALRRTHRAVAGLGIEVRSRGRARLVVEGSPSLENVLVALVRLSIASGATAVTGYTAGDAVEVHFADAMQRGPMFGHLADALGASLARVPEGDGFVLHFAKTSA